jgi:hypothetical protein
MQTKSYFCIILSLFLLSFTYFTLPTYVSGHLRQKKQGHTLRIAHTSVVVKYKNKILAQATTDKKGDFEMVIPDNIRPYDSRQYYKFYACLSKKDTVLLAAYTIFEFGSDTPDLVFYIPNKKRNRKE